MALRRVPLRLGFPHACGYLPGNEARFAWVDPGWASQPGVYDALVSRGFRRSGADIYKPVCEHCSACVPVRIPVHDFKPDRSQRRTVKRNGDLAVTERDAGFTDDHYSLYLRYQKARHADGGMANLGPSEVYEFLACDWQRTQFVEFRLKGRLLAVAVADRVDSGFSAVYTFFDPDESRRSLGSHAVLYLIERARELGLRWCYLGYWIGGSRKMDYKRYFRPLEAWMRDGWVRLPSETLTPSVPPE